ncbi:hypothetical protein SAY86_012211 [Trapa natans]|uniref:Verticillium wilt resistance-like protein n=1 Tax=Trapa natans TaxID=22666 RepID=A0AAN7LX46_TRANT|nr:hypothetical protein SAY86_012211 [Trapa natans]
MGPSIVFLIAKTSVPEFFADFPNLTTLCLSTSGLFGMFPHRILQVPTLQNLDLSFNSLLQGFLPEFSRNSSLQTVALSFTNFSGMLPDSIGNLRNLSRLSLANCSFLGKIPSSMSELSHLAYLDFSINEFNGTIPSFTASRNLTRIILSHNALTGDINSTQWEYLQNLQTLDLRNNLLQGSIPSSLFALPHIQKVQLSENKFSGEVQLNESSNFSAYRLDTLDLSSNDLDGPIPTALFRFPELKYLSLSFNNFNGSIDINVIQDVSGLSYLDLSYNNLQVNAGIRSYTKSFLPPLSTLRLASCHLRTLPDFLLNQSKLINLDLSNNEIEGIIPRWIWRLENLLYLNLSLNYFNNMESPMPTSTMSLLDLHSNRLQGKMPPLPPLATYVDYSSNRFNSSVPNDIGKNLSVTIFFSLSNNRFYGNVPESICQAGYLQVLDLSTNSFRGRIPSCMANTSLKVLNLQRNYLTGSIPEGFPTTCGLRTLDLSRNQLNGHIPSSLSNCTMLEVLNVASNQMDGYFPCHLKNTTKLRVLVMRENGFSGQIGCPRNGCKGTWDLLQIVDLADNFFNALPPKACLETWKAMQTNKDDTNHIQSSFLELSGLYYQDSVTVTVKGLVLELVKILRVFTSIDFSRNNISAQIPEAFGTFGSLRLLNMSGNEFSGPIPPYLGNLQVLESLDLSRNFLNGSIPLTLSNLRFLSTLNLSYNQLIGPIPRGKQFDTFEANSYEGNDKLCGLPLQRVCRNSTPEDDFKAPPPEVQFDWQIISTGLGFGSGAAIVITPLTLWKRSQRWYSYRIDRFLLVFLPMLGFTYMIWDDQESEDISERGNDNQFDLNEEKSRERYCIFCSRLDYNMMKVIHDPNCTCRDTPYNSSFSSSYTSS